MHHDFFRAYCNLLRDDTDKVYHRLERFVFMDFTRQSTSYILHGVLPLERLVLMELVLNCDGIVRCGLV